MRKMTVARLLGLSTLLTGWTSFLLIFLAAYSHSTKSVTVFINNYGEANIELFILLATIPLVWLIFNEYTSILGREEREEDRTAGK